MKVKSKNRWFIAALFSIFLLLVGCKVPETLVQPLIPHHIFFSRNDIQKRIDDRWHYDKKVLSLFEVKIGSPLVMLLPDANRLKCKFDLNIRRPFSSRILKGSITVAGEIRFDVSTRSVYLVNTEVQAIDSEGFEVNDPVLQTISSLFGGTLTDIRLYELKPEDLRYAGVQFDPIHFKVKSDGIDIELEARSQHVTTDNQ